MAKIEDECANVKKIINKTKTKQKQTNLFDNYMFSHHQPVVNKIDSSSTSAIADDEI